MIAIITIILVLALIGALLGKKSFGESVRGGCGCILAIIIVIAIAGAIVAYLYSTR